MRSITDITVYWNVQDRDNEGWAYRAGDEHGPIESGACNGADDLDEAIADACSQLGIALTPDQFAREPHIDGGYAVWTA